MEEKKVVVEDCGYPDSESPKSLRGKTPYKYDGKTSLPDARQEEYINRIIYNMGDHKKAYEEVYFPNVNAPNYSGSAPYRFFERKGFIRRYKFLMDRAMYSVGLDKKTLLLKTAQMIEAAVQANKAKEFTSLVDTVLKLQVDETKYRALQPPTAYVAPSREDLAPVKELLDSLNG